MLLRITLIACIAAFGWIIASDITSNGFIKAAYAKKGDHSGSSHDDGGHDSGSHDDEDMDDEGHEEGHEPGSKGKGAKGKGGSHHDYTPSTGRHNIESKIFHGKHGKRWTDEWKGKGGHDDDDENDDDHDH